jgi:NTE family protein
MERLGPMQIPGTPARPPRRRLNLALQGGGAHGAFTWGVLDQLLADTSLHIEGLSGSSAGAINAVVLADGWLKGGRRGAREALATLWAELGRLMPGTLVVQGRGDAIKLAPGSAWLARWASQFSPAQMNPLDLNPLRNLLTRLVDFDALRARSPARLFVAATQANTGKLRVFGHHELTVEVLLASCCLPKIHRAVEIDGEPYWDGAFSANPAVFPLMHGRKPRDLLLVLLNPLRREATPRTAKEIDQRIGELAFSANFMREMQSLARASRFSDAAADPQAAQPAVQHPAGATEWPAEAFSSPAANDAPHRDSAAGQRANPRPLRHQRGTRVHMIDISDLASLKRTDTQALAYPPFLELLRNQGQERARAWLANHSHAVGQRSTVNVQQLFG